MTSPARSKNTARAAGRLAAASLLAVAGAGTAAAQTGSITFSGGVSHPSCGFRPAGGLLQARCLEPTGQTVSAPLPMPPERLPGQIRVGMARLDVEPAHLRQRDSTPHGYVLVATYQ